MDGQAPEAPQSPEARMASFFASEESEAPTPEAATAEPENETVQEPESKDEPDEGDDFEVDGQLYKLPPELKSKVQEWRDGAMMREDYSRKTQAVAELHKHVSAVAEAASLREAFEKEIAPERDQLSRVKSQLESFKSLDWNNVDAEIAQKLYWQREQLKEQASDLEKTIGSKANEFRNKQQTARDQILAQAQRYIQSEIKGWGPDKAREVHEAAAHRGYSAEELQHVMDPRFVLLAHDAAQWRKLQASKMEAVRSAKSAPPVVKPGATQGANVAAERRYEDARKSFKRDGSREALERLFTLRGI